MTARHQRMLGGADQSHPGRREEKRGQGERREEKEWITEEVKKDVESVLVSKSRSKVRCSAVQYGTIQST